MFDIKSFYEAKDVADAIKALVNDSDAEIISGGTDVLIRVREGKDAGKSVVSIHNIEALKGVRLLEDGSLWIGAGTAFSHITNDPLIQKYIPMLGDAVDMVGGPQIRNTGTIGGNICNGATSADSASTMWTLEAEVLLEGPDGRRSVPVCEFYTGPGRTVRERTEVCTGFLIPRDSFEGWSGHYIKYGKRKAMERIEDVRLGYGVAGPTPLRCRKAENGLKGHAVNDSGAILAFGKAALEEVNPRSSWRASKEFRLQLIEELSKRALTEAIKKAGGAVNA